MTNKDVVITNTKRCSVCKKKLYHGYKAVAIISPIGNIKAYCCDDNCARIKILGKIPF